MSAYDWLGEACIRGYSSVAERLTADQQVLSSTLGGPFSQAVAIFWKCKRL
jgi:hypothetical protein